KHNRLPRLLSGHGHGVKERAGAAGATISLANPMPQSTHRWWRPETGIFLGIWLILIIAGRDGLFKDPGTLWHIVVGQRILETRQLIYTDPFSFACAGKPWIAQQWLGECVLAILYDIGGFDTILLATATLLAAFFAWLGHRL